MKPLLFFCGSPLLVGKLSPSQGVLSDELLFPSEGVASQAACIVPLSSVSIYNLQEWVSFSPLPCASSELALQAVLEDNLKRVRVESCLGDWFTHFSGGSSVFSVRFLAYPLRFVNSFDIKVCFSLPVFQHWYYFTLCISSSSPVSSHFDVDMLFCQRVSVSFRTFSYTPNAKRQTVHLQPPTSNFKQNSILSFCFFPLKKDTCHFFCFHLTRIQGHEVFSLSRWVPSQGALTKKKDCGTLCVQAENKKLYHPTSIDNRTDLSRAMLSCALFAFCGIVFPLSLRYPVSKSGSAKYITGCFLFFFSPGWHDAVSKSHRAKCIRLLASSFSFFILSFKQLVLIGGVL